FSGVKAGTDVDPERAHAVTNRRRAPHGASRPVEARKKAVARRVNLAAAKPRQLTPRPVVIAFEEVPPTAVSELRRSLRRSDDVDEENRGEHAVVLGNGPGARQEFLDLVEDGVLVAEVWVIVLPRKLDGLCTWNICTEVAASCSMDHVSRPIDDESGN